MTLQVDISFFLISLVLPGLFILGGIFDVLTTRIPDGISISLVVAFVFYAIFQNYDLNTFGLHFGVAVLVFLSGFVMFSLGWMGGGDGKLAAAGALWFGPNLVLPFVLLSFMLGGIMVMAMIGLRSIPLPQWVHRQSWLMQWVSGQNGFPFGFAMAISVLAIVSIEF